VPFYHCEVTLDDESTLSLLRMMGADGRLSADHFLLRGNCAVMALNRHDLKILRHLGLKVSVGQNLLQQARRVKAERLRGAIEAHGLHTGFVDHYLDTIGIFSRFTSLHSEFPTLTQWIDLPYPTLGYDGSRASLTGPATVKLFRINTTPAVTSKPGLLLIAGTHAREWIPPLVAIEFAEQLLRTYSPGSTNPVVQTINQIVEGLDIFIVPALNPDGINFSHHDFAMWRKNRRANPLPSTPCSSGTFDHNGVDNNRNYSIYWGEAGSSGAVCNDSFRGSFAFSEPENRNLLNIVELYPNILTAVDCHSFGESIFRAQPTGGVFIASEPVEPRDHNIFLALEAAMNAAISSVSPGKTYSTGTTNNHAGTSDDYLFLAHRIFGFTIECAQQFQPPIADALVAVQEVSAALRALAEQTLSLASQFTFPVNIIHVVDRSSSMIASGYVEPTKSNVRRMIDLMSLNDSLGLVSFNQTATPHIALTAITNPGVYVSARNAVDAIAFGGYTSIGAGLQTAGNLLSGASGPKAIILLSDGYQNRAPWVDEALPLLPSGTKVHTIALGSHSDQALLESIADTTGGTYYFSPDELELHEIYNYIRAEATEEELALNETLAMAAGESDGAVETRQVVVDESSAYGIFTVSWNNPAIDLRVILRPPDGPVMDLSRVHRINGRAYKVLRLRRPQAGVWSLQIQRESGHGAVSCTVAAFLRSDLRLRLVTGAKTFIAGRPLSTLVQIRDHGHVVNHFQGTALISRPAASLSTLLQDWKKKLPPVLPAQLKAKDALPKSVLQALMIRDRLHQQSKQDPLRYLQAEAKLRLPSVADLARMGFTATALKALGLCSARFVEGEAMETTQTAGIGMVAYTKTPVPGTYNIRVRVEGRSDVSGHSFVRVGLRSLRFG
jgi:hypothetical protein